MHRDLREGCWECGWESTRCMDKLILQCATLQKINHNEVYEAVKMLTCSTYFPLNTHRTL